MNTNSLGIVLAAASLALFSVGAFAQADRSTTTTAPTQPPSDRTLPPGGDVAPRPDMYPDGAERANEMRKDAEREREQERNKEEAKDRDGDRGGDGEGEGLSSEERDFLENAAQSGLAEVEGSRLALDSDASEPVRVFAQKMIEDHTKAHDELRELAESKNFTLPDDPSVLQRTELVALRALSGQPFNRMYAARIGEAAHENAVELFEEASREVKDTEIRAYIDKHLPKLREHLKLARELRAQVGNDGDDDNDNRDNR